MMKISQNSNEYLDECILPGNTMQISVFPHVNQRSSSEVVLYGLFHKNRPLLGEWLLSKSLCPLIFVNMQNKPIIV